MFRPFALCVALAITPAALSAHEFWIEPFRWQVPPDTLIEAHIRVGQDMKGPAHSYFPENTRRFQVATPVGIYNAGQTIGDRPVLRGTARDNGLYVVIYATGDLTIDYEEPGKFESFVTHKGLEYAIAQHAERGLPKTGFTEQYSRYAKSLISVGHGRGEDRVFGLLTEITAMANPYTDDLSDGMPVYVGYQGQPRADVHVDVFERDAEGTVTLSAVRTNENGIAVIDVKPGHDYMVDSVVIRPLEAASPADPVWETLWANLTFHVPAK